MSQYIVIFIFCSFCGWIWESIYCTCCRKKWANRGFLYGPICPIYGFAGVTAYAAYALCTAGILPFLTWWQIFLLGFAVSMLLEYPTSYVLEKLFHARWWDYSRLPLNINGRTSVPTSAAFGAAAILIMKYLMPHLTMRITVFPEWLITLLAFTFTAVISADATLTISALTDFQARIQKMDDSFQSHMTEKVDQMISAQNDFRSKAIKRIVVFKLPLEKAKAKIASRKARKP